MHWEKVRQSYRGAMPPLRDRMAPHLSPLCMLLMPQPAVVFQEKNNNIVPKSYGSWGGGH